MHKVFHIGILGAMPEEIGEVINHLKDIQEVYYGDLKIISGELVNGFNSNKILISTAWSGWGKVSSARAATRILSSTFKGQSVDLLIFTGVAGSAKKELKQWDIVIANSLVQHDMDARPIFPKYVIPSIKKVDIDIAKNLISWSELVLKNEIKFQNLKCFGKVVKGKIATGDQFIADKNKINKLKEEIPNLCAVEMEGASVAQVAQQEKLPCLIIRVISDEADEKAAQNFEEFLKIYKKRSWEMIRALLKNLNNLEID